MSNPFIFGDPVRGDDFLNRKQELRRLVGRVLVGGSAVVTAEPRMGKTSLLLYLQDNVNDLFGARANKTIFRYLDGHTMSGWNVERFWKEALQPLHDLPAVQTMSGNTEPFDFGAWEQVFKQLEREGYLFILLLDEFDAIQDETGLHQRAVYGNLRSLASRHRSFSLVVASRRTLTDLNHKSRDFAAGSPFFNFVQEVNPAPFPQKDMSVLLSRTDRFTQDDRRFLKLIGGQHPYFLQTAAYYLYDLYEEYEDEEDALIRYEKSGEEFYQSTSEAVLTDIWNSWTPYTQMAFTLSALESMHGLLRKDGPAFDVSTLLRDLPNFSPELRKLEKRGFLRADGSLENGYTPHAEVMLWYLADELTRITRPEISLKKWLTDQKWEGLLKTGEKEAIKRVLQQAGGLLKGGAEAFIKAAAEGAAKGMVS